MLMLSVVFIIAGAIVLLIGIINIFGKGTTMIAGYNTKSEEEKAKVNIEPVSRFIGIMLIIGSLIFIVSGILILFNVFPIAAIIDVSITLFLIVIIPMPIYLNISKRFKRLK